MVLALVCLAPCWTVCADDAAAKDAAPPPLHQRIDQLMDQDAVGPTAGLCSDADFVRRVWLDAAGMVPPASEVRAFLADTSSDKRIRLIDRLLASPQFTRHMTLVLDAIINERHADKGVTTAEWQGFLYQSLADGKPLNKLLREVIVADGVDPALRPAAKFMLDRDCEPNAVTRDLGRLVFGMDLQCAQCHDHPLVDDYLQADYYGLYAFVLRSNLFADPKNKQVRQIGETADGEASFKSVFTGHSGDKVQPRLPKGLPIFEPVVLKGEEYVSKPSKETRAVPKYSRRQQLAEKFETSLPFRRNLANRLWALVMGRGLVHPVDAHHPANPPAHPAVLTLLADELPRFNYDVKSFLRELLLTSTYQRSCELDPPTEMNAVSYDQQIARLLEQQPTLQADKDAKFAAWRECQVKLAEVQKQLADGAKTLEPLKASLAAAEAEVAKAQTAATKGTEELAVMKAQAQAVQIAADKSKEAAALLKDDKELIAASEKIAARAKAAQDAEQATMAKMGALAAAVETQQQKVAEAKSALDTAAAKLPTPDQVLELESQERQLNATFNDAQYLVADLDKRLSLARLGKQHSELSQSDPAAAERLWVQILEELANRGQVALLKPLSAEQFAYSAMQAAGVLANHQTTAEAAVAKAKPEAWVNAADADKPQVMQRLSEPKVFESVRGQLAEFIRLYGGLPGQDFQATVNQALFFGNGSMLEGWLKASPGSLMSRLQEAKEPAAVADELYCSVLGRPATEEETTAVADFLRDRNEDRAVALVELTWALLASSEFRFNH
jgi:predicted  nucleic acid-binding Zn-ribbon protein